MHIIEKISLTDEQKQQLLRLWNKEYPKKLEQPDLADFNSYLNSLIPKRHFLLLSHQNEIKGWFFLFEREEAQWFAMILDGSIHGKGYGTELLKRVQAKETNLNGWVIDHNSERKSNGALYRSPLPFYLKNGFVLKPDDRLETDKISAVKICWAKPAEPF